MEAYLDNNTYTMYAQDGDIIIGDVQSAAVGLQTLHLELKEIKIYSTVLDVDTPYFRNSFLDDEQEFQNFKEYVFEEFSSGMCVTICRNRLIIYYKDKEFFMNNNNLQIESAKITVG